MSDDGSGPPQKAKQVQFVVEPRQPLRVIEIGESEDGITVGSSTAKLIGETFKTYREASKTLLDGKYSGSRHYAPPHLREPSSAFVLTCSDGILVRYDPPGDARPRVTVGIASQSLAELAPQISEQVLHFPSDPRTYVPPAGGVQLSLGVRDGQAGAFREHMALNLIVCGTTKLPHDFKMPAPPARQTRSPLTSVELHRRRGAALGAAGRRWPGPSAAARIRDVSAQ